MGYKTLCFGFSCILLAYCLYSPIPENIEEPWKVRFTDTLVRVISHMVIYFKRGISVPWYKYIQNIF
jgi:arylacetamide deacetylase-like 2